MSKYSELFRTTAKTTPAEIDAQQPAPSAQAKEETGFSLLFVDDEAGVISALKRIFIDENYSILTATSGPEALSLMDKGKVHLVISDHRMPGMTGAQLLKEIKQKWPETIRIMLTGYADVQSIMGAVNEGAVYKFITKPWNDEDLRLTVSLALQQYILIQENKQLKELTKKQQHKIKSYSSLFDEDRGVLGSILVKSGVIGKEGLDRALIEKKSDEVLSEVIVRLGITSESKIIKALQNSLKLEYLDLREMSLPLNVVRFLPREFCEKNRLMPIKLDSKQLTMAMADPSDIYKCDNIAMLTGLKVIPVIATSSQILAQLQKIYGDSRDSIAVLDDPSDLEPLDEIDIIIEEEENDVNVNDLIGSSGVPPIIRIVNAIISEAVRYKASDIHIEPKTKYTVIRYRIDGMLYSKIKIPSEFHAATISRIKILGKIDISERRKPQDGRITVKTGTRIVDIRVSTMPTINGEKIVMRILDKNAAIKELGELGISPGDLLKINSLAKKPQGIIISTGPTGSGKTTMLYSLLNAMMETTKNFETIEDPVEYFLEEANQVYIREKVGLSFASVLRATLRQDPDIILVGEIRDFDTADVAFKAALTGHMVLTTLHTNSSVASITRLLDMGVKSYLIASALEGIAAQRLVRKVCKYCKTSCSPDEGIIDLLKIPSHSVSGEVYMGRGCEKCNQTGYLGRTGIYELFVMTDDFRHLISSNYKESELVDIARANGMKTLIEEGISKVNSGETTLEELVRVIGPQPRKKRNCDKCLKVIDTKFYFCPYCGTFKQNICHSCKLPLEEDWNICPVCGITRGGKARNMS